jgi:hypothetical protein
MKKLILVFGFLFLSALAMACPECEKRQPKILKGIAHGAGPESQWDYVIVYGMALIVAFTLVATIIFIIKPREDSKNHIKRTILNNQ